MVHRDTIIRLPHKTINFLKSLLCIYIRTFHVTNIHISSSIPPSLYSVYNMQNAIKILEVVKISPLSSLKLGARFRLTSLSMLWEVIQFLPSTASLSLLW